MIPSCRAVSLLLCFATSLGLAGCASSNQERSNWEKEVQQLLVSNKRKFQVCGRYLARSARHEDIHLGITFRVNPSGALETMWLDESGKWDQRFYDCVFNVVDRLRFPSIDEDTALEVRQILVYKGKKR